MSLDHILLGMLKKPCSGYDLGRQFSDGPVHFWSAELSQIYPALGAMTERGWLSSASAHSEKGPRRLLYTRTNKGKAELQKWLRGGPVLRTERYAHVGQLIYMGEVNDLEVTREFLERLLQHYEEKLDILKSAESAYEEVDSTDSEEMDADAFHDFLSIQIGVETFRARVRACRNALKLIRLRITREDRDD